MASKPPVRARELAPAAPAAKRAPAQSAPAQPASEESAPEESVVTGRRFLIFQAVPSWMVSAVIHAILVIVLALISLPEIIERENQVVELGKEEVVEEVDDLPITPDEQPIIEETNVDLQAEAVAPITSEVPVETEISQANDLDAPPASVELDNFGEQTAPRENFGDVISKTSGKGVSGRGAAARQGMLAKYGGSQGSESAVKAALEWFRNHQYPDGSWSFDHRGGGNIGGKAVPCRGQCSHPGSLGTARNAATAMALLPFLGFGITHKEGDYKKNVEAGLGFLLRSAKPKNGGGSWEESGGSMYSHGLCSIAICEAYAMTHDRMLRYPAQASINYIVYAQDPIGGGWRYSARQPGDTSAVGWQIMALKSGHMGYLAVPPNTVRGATKFLDSVQIDSGAKYGYNKIGGGQGTTAVGLLCRMYMGWKQDHPGLQRGVEYLSRVGPSLRGSGTNLSGNMYYNYYATQVMKHYEGEAWDKWNGKMRDALVNAQSKSGHMKGSWYMAKGDHGAERAGRLYCTSMATMILEVYYRHMPIYQKQASEEDFPL